jgi:hypothetical protein
MGEPFLSEAELSSESIEPWLDGFNNWHVVPSSYVSVSGTERIVRGVIET